MRACSSRWALLTNREESLKFHTTALAIICSLHQRKDLAPNSIAERILTPAWMCSTKITTSTRHLKRQWQDVNKIESQETKGPVQINMLNSHLQLATLQVIEILLPSAVAAIFHSNDVNTCPNYTPPWTPACIWKVASPPSISCKVLIMYICMPNLSAETGQVMHQTVVQA